MRIAYMLTSLGFGGAERQVVALAERMAARGHQVLLIVLRHRAEHVWPANVPVVYLDMSKSLTGIMSGLVRGRRALLDFQPDLVHSHTFPANMAARLLRASGASPRTLSTIHNIYEGGWHRTFACRITDRLAIHTTAVSRAVATRCIETERWRNAEQMLRGSRTESIQSGFSRKMRRPQRSDAGKDQRRQQFHLARSRPHHRRQGLSKSVASLCAGARSDSSDAPVTGGWRRKESGRRACSEPWPSTRGSWSILIGSVCVTTCPLCSTQR